MKDLVEGKRQREREGGGKKTLLKYMNSTRELQNYMNHL